MPAEDSADLRADRLPVAGLLRAGAARRGRDRGGAQLRRSRAAADPHRLRRARLPRAAAGSVTSGGPSVRSALPTGSSPVATRGRGASWSRSTSRPRPRSWSGDNLEAARAVADAPASAGDGELLVASRGRRTPGAASRSCAPSGLARRRRRPRCVPADGRSAPLEPRPHLAAHQRQHRPAQAGRPHAGRRSPRSAGEQPPRHLAVPLRPRRLRLVAGRDPGSDPARPAHRLRRARRARHLARARAGGRRHRGVGHPDLLAPGPVSRPRERGGAAARAGHPRRRAGRPGDPHAAREMFPEARVSWIYASSEAGATIAVHDGRAGFPAGLAGPRGTAAGRRSASRTASSSSARPSAPRASTPGCAPATASRSSTAACVITGRIASDEINVGGAKARRRRCATSCRPTPPWPGHPSGAARRPIVGSIVTADVVPRRPRHRRPSSPGGAPSGCPTTPSRGASGSSTPSRSRRH